MFRVLATLLATTIAHGINWNGNWGTSCDFIGNDFINSLSTGKECGGRCASIAGCTHYTWTNYNGGTCWMKKNSVSKNNAVPKYDEGAVCGVIVHSGKDRAITGVVTGSADGVVAVGGVIIDSAGGAITGNVSGVIASGINWNGKNWAASCHFIGNDLTNDLTEARDCDGRCASTPGCTHYTWTNYKGGTCWMKKNSVSKGDAVQKNDQGAVCGVAVSSAGGANTGNVSGVIASGINWNGKNWAASCHFIGNDLTNDLTKAKDCGGRCASNPGCTHYTWTNYKGGTCWMKKNSVSKSDAVPKYDKGAVCGVAVISVGGAVAGNVNGVIASGINWNGKNWAASCHFIGNDLTNDLTTAKDCGGRCASTPGCTHYTWTNYKGGTCWMKKNSVSKGDAVQKNDQGAVCGVAVSSAGGANTGNVSGVIASGINWNGKNWAASCHFIGNDLTNDLTKAKDCGGRCASTPGCTHYTWTNYKGGTCWMKKNSVSKSDAVPKYDKGAVCGVAVISVGGAVAGNVNGVIASGINWNGKNWAASCHFIGNDLTNDLTTTKDCGGRCASTPGCTHYTWTNYKGGTCWMKKNSVSKGDAVQKNDQGAVCGVAVSSAGGANTGNVSGVIASGINWNGKNWAASCHFIGNDLTNDLTKAKDCGGRCASTPGCTHYTWTNYKCGTCWMKKNSVSKSDAVPKYDQEAVCGVAVISEGGVVAGNVNGVIATGINWNGKNWAASCHFIGNDLTNDLTTAKDCGGRCASTPGCTHYTWTNYKGGTCWMKKNSVSKGDAVQKNDQGAVCGVAVSSAGGANTGNVSGVIASGINWNGKNWAASCHFIGNDLTNDLTKAKDCGGRCASTPGCTHYTWTNYKCGTCWMKKNSVSKSDAVPKYDQEAVCGVAVISEGGVVAGNVNGVIATGINWNGKNWAASCHFIGNDLTNDLTTAKDCGGRCASTPGCTHYTWTNYKGGTCWMKKNSVSKGDAVPKYDQGAVCGVTISNAGEVITGSVGEVGASGNNCVASCDLFDNDLTNVLTRAEDCGGRCMSTPGCTHYTWTKFNGGTCWMKRNSLRKEINVVTKYDQGLFIDYFRRPIPYHNQIIINLY